MSFEQPSFEENENKVEQKPSNVIEGPWIKQRRAEEEAEINQKVTDFLEAVEQSKEHQVIEVEGLWPKKDIPPQEAAPESEPIEVPVEDVPLEIPEDDPLVEVPMEPMPEAKEAQIERAREDLQVAFDQQGQANPEPTAPEGGSESKNHPFVEMYTVYKPCDVCKGRKRRWLFFPCPACQGRGTVPDKMTVTRGVM